MTKKIEVMVQEAFDVGYAGGVHDTGCYLKEKLIESPPWQCYFDRNLLVKDCKQAGPNSLPWPPCAGCIAPQQFRLGFDKGWDKGDKNARADFEELKKMREKESHGREMDGRP